MIFYYVGVIKGEMKEHRDGPDGWSFPLDPIIIFLVLNWEKRGKKMIVRKKLQNHLHFFIIIILIIRV